MKKKCSILCWYLILIVYLEFFYKSFIWGFSYKPSSFLFILYSIPFAFLFYIITNLFSEKVNKILNAIMTFLITLLFASQFVYYKFYEAIFSVYSVIRGTKQVSEFYNQILDIMLQNWYVLLILFIPFILFIIFGRKLFSMKRLKGEKLLILLIVFAFTYGMTFLLTFVNKKGIYSVKNLYYNVHSPTLTANKIGLLSTEKLDIKRFIFGFEEKIVVSGNGLVDDVEPEEEKIIEYNKLDIDFDNLIENETSETIKTMHEYFKNVAPTQKNDYTGMFEGKNLIYITAEGFDGIVVSEELTPTLYKLVNNGFVFENYYQPIFPVSTSDGEYMNVTSLIPKEGVWSFYRSSKIYMPYGLGNVFKKLGYTTFGYHDHLYGYYDRNLSHPNLGLDYYGCGNGLERRINCDIWPESDLEMMEATVSDYINSEHFATYYMTVSGHLRYNWYNSMAVKNRDAVRDLPYSEAVKAYIAQNIELDKALENLINQLEEAGKLDDTLIVLSPDHYPYGLTKEEMSELATFDVFDKFELYRTSLIMYNPTVEKTVIKKYASSIDILPTVFNLFNVEYDSRLLMGRDLLDASQEGLVILSDRSWMTDRGRYNSITGEFKSNTEEEVSEEYITNINAIVYQKFTMSSYILDNNYYSYLGI